MARGQNLIWKLEHQTRQRITIASAHTEENLSKCNPQQQSILFNRLPLELRELVWQYATSPTEDKERQYGKTEWYYRLGHTAPAKYDTSLLLTCRRVWLEANGFPMLQAEHCFWYDRPAPDGRSLDWTAQLTYNNRRNFGTIHLYAHMGTIEGLKSTQGSLRCYFSRPHNIREEFQPRVMHVTIRHTDWWWWESDEPLRFKDEWFQAMLDTEDLRSTYLLKLELETLDYKVDQMMPIVERLSKLASAEYDTHIVDGKPTTTRFVLQDNREVCEWSGPSRIDNREYGPYQGLNTLNYHAVTLTWRLHFPQLGSVHVPTMRLAPRIDAHKKVASRIVEDDREIAEIRRTVPSLFRYERSNLDDVEQWWRFDMDGNLEDLVRFERMQDDQASIIIGERRVAQIAEVYRRFLFNREMGRWQITCVPSRWGREGCLLNFVGEDSLCRCEAN